MKQYLEAGCIINKRGLKGEVKVDSYCDSLDVLCDIKTLYFDADGKNSTKVISAKPYKGYVYMMLEGISTVEDADKARGTVLYANRDDIPIDEGGFFIDDLLGLSVVDIDTKKVYGTVKDIFNSGAGDIYTVSDGEREYFLPAVDEFVIEIDLEKGIFVRPIPGIFDEAEKV